MNFVSTLLILFLTSVTGVNVCWNQGDCKIKDTFCLLPARPLIQLLGSNGQCQPCWKCCVFPEDYGSCPPGCLCNVGTICSNIAQNNSIYGNCGQGLECRRNLNNPAMNYDTSINYNTCRRPRYRKILKERVC